MNPVVAEKDMAFSPENEQWIHAQIQKALAVALKDIKPPSGIRKALYLLREWGILGVILTIIVTLIIFALTQWNSANTRLAVEASFRTHTEDRLTAIEANLLAIRATLVAEAPTKKRSQIEAIEVLSTAKASSISLPRAVVEEAGTNFIDASRSSPEAWPVGLDFAAYRTIFNNNPVPNEPHQDFQNIDRTNYQLHTAGGKPEPRIESTTASTSLPIEESARLEFIRNPPNQTAKTGPAWLFVIGGAPIFDAMHIRRVVFQNAEIHYSGGPANLEDVVFVNCTFVFDNVENGRELGKQILISSRVNFRTAG